MPWKYLFTLNISDHLTHFLLCFKLLFLSKYKWISEAGVFFVEQGEREGCNCHTY